jgi:DNA-binding PadR family transcriptional regulator
MRSPVNWGTLGLVIERPSYGYEIFKRFERLYGAALASNPPAIYRALDELDRRGYVERFPAPRGAATGPRQTKPHYRGTEAGINAYEHWFIGQAREHTRHSLQFARQLGAFSEQPQTALAILDRYEQMCLNDKQARIPGSGAFDGVEPALAERLASALGRNFKAATLQWIALARKEFEGLDEAQH